MDSAIGLVYGFTIGAVTAIGLISFKIYAEDRFKIWLQELNQIGSLNLFPKEENTMIKLGQKARDMDRGMTVREYMVEIINRLGVEPNTVYRVEIDADCQKKNTAKIIIHCYDLRDGKLYRDGDYLATLPPHEYEIEME